VRAAPECVPCILRQALSAARRVTDDPWVQRKLLFAVMEHLPTLNFDRPPAELSYEAMRFACKYLGVADPFAEDKRRFTEKMLAVEDHMRQRIRQAPEPLLGAIRFALAGNMIDLGILDDEAIERELREDAEGLELAINDYEDLKAALHGARSVVYILDNAGEVVCDKLVIEQLGRPEAWCVVRKAPIINDATRSDAEAVGLGRLAKITDIGTEALGVPLSHCSADFRELFTSADVVISKGQANFETLDEADRPIFHILRAKCEHIARFLGVPLGSAALVRTPRVCPTES